MIEKGVQASIRRGPLFIMSDYTKEISREVNALQNVLKKVINSQHTPNAYIQNRRQWNKC